MAQNKLYSSGKKLGALILTFLLMPGSLSHAQETPSASSSNINYNDNLMEVTDSGIYDAQGKLVAPSQLSVLQKAAALDANTFSLSPAAPAQSNFSEYKSSLTQNWGDQAGFARSQLSSVQSDIEAQQDRFEALEEVIHQTQEDLHPLEEEISTLENQLNLYNGEIDRLKEKIRQVETLIAEKKIALKDLIRELSGLNAEFELLKGVATDFIRLLYEQGSRVKGLENQAQDPLKLLLSEQTVGQQALDELYLETMEETGRQVFHRLEGKRQEAQEKQKQIEQEQVELNYLLQTLTQEKRSLEQVRLSKTELLEVTQGKEQEYLRLLQEAEEERKQLEFDLSNLKDVEEFLRQQLVFLQQGWNQVQQAGKEGDLLGLSRVPSVKLVPGSASASSPGDFQVDPKLLEMMQNDLKEGTEQLGLSWPVTPNKVTAEFSDAGYKATFGWNHEAVDLRARQGSLVYAAADGMVVKTSLKGTNFGFMVIAHGRSSLPPDYTGKSQGLTTLYGHVSQVDVRPGQIVKRGQVIGRSGGTPGTIGSGLHTTAAHMHFEVRNGGKLVDPLQYLILLGVNDDFLPSKWKSDQRDRLYWPKGS